MRRSGESRNPERETSLRRSPLARMVRLDSGLRRNDNGDQASRFTDFLKISQRERERTPAFKTRLPSRESLSLKPGTAFSGEGPDPFLEVPSQPDVADGVGLGIQLLFQTLIPGAIE